VPMTNAPESRDLKRRDEPGLASGLIPDWLDAVFLRTLLPAIRHLVSARVNPNWLTIFALGFSVVASAAILLDRPLLAFGCLVTGGILDFVDGKVAVLTGRVTKAGAVLDSSLDRYSDATVYLALLVYFGQRAHAITALAAVVALVGSMMTSYLMALAKSHGVELRVGLLRRQDRLTLVSIGLLLTPLHESIADIVTTWATRFGVTVTSVPLMPLAAMVFVLAVLCNVTALQRLALLLRVVDRRPGKPTGHAAKSLRQRQLEILEHEIKPVKR
jgi:CDP-diacylglycerol--glycerol-3-phosphate 3-phosphatidyltransferase